MGKSRLYWPITVSWLLTVSLSTIITVSSANDLTPLGWMYCISMTLLALTIPIHPLRLAGTALTLDFIFTFVPNDTAPFMFPSIWLSLATIGYSYKKKFQLISLLSLSLASLFIPLFLPLSSLTLGNTITASCTYILASVSGYLYRQQQRQHRLQIAEQKAVNLATRNNIAIALHDSLSGHLSYVALKSQQRMDDPSTTESDRSIWLDIYNQTRYSLDAMHTIIDVLNGKEQYSGQTISTLINTLITKNNSIIHNLGIKGQTLIHLTTDHPAKHPSCIEAISLLEELYSNIVRHCHKGSTYLMTVSVDLHCITITQIDDERHPNQITGLKHHGYGLQTHKKRITELGGTMSYSDNEHDGWSLQARIPLAMH